MKIYLAQIFLSILEKSLKDYKKTIPTMDDEILESYWYIRNKPEKIHRNIKMLN